MAGCGVMVCATREALWDGEASAIFPVGLSRVKGIGLVMACVEWHVNDASDAVSAME